MFTKVFLFVSPKNPLILILFSFSPFIIILPLKIDDFELINKLEFFLIRIFLNHNYLIILFHINI